MGFFYNQAARGGFALGSLGLERERPYGVAMCRGDVSVSDCSTFIIGAGIEIRKRCPYNKGAIIWYDNCLLKYFDEDFIGKLDNENKFYLLNVQNVTDGLAFDQKVKELLTQLGSEASTLGKMFVDGELELEGSNKLYGLAQCTRDLSAADCKKCIDDAISELPNCCSGKEGGRVVGGCCNIRYETYPFVNT